MSVDLSLVVFFYCSTMFEQYTGKVALIDMICFGCSAMLILTKIPDFITTWQGIKHSRDISIEQNPIARWLFHKCGIPMSFALLAFIYVILVVLMHVALYPLVDFTHQLVPMMSKEFVLSGKFNGYASFRTGKDYICR